MGQPENLFNSAKLSLAVPDASVDTPAAEENGGAWLRKVQEGSVERKQAFFDERLSFYALISIPNPGGGIAHDVHQPPDSVLDFISRLQVSFDASYIAPSSLNTPSASSLRPVVPPRSDSVGKVTPSASSLKEPSMFPPTTPRPTPAAIEKDQKYVRTEGTVFMSRIWGQTPSNDSNDVLRVIHAEDEWVAVYRASVTISFLRLSVEDPLLSLTVSATLRDPLASGVGPEHPLMVYLSSVGFDASSKEAEASEPTSSSSDSDDGDEEGSTFEEINLLEGLASGSTFASSGSNSVVVPSTRLSTRFRRDLFQLDAATKTVIKSVATPTHPANRPTPHPTLRKSFRKTMHTVSGFRVRMRTVYVPRILFNGSGENIDDLHAGSEERSVVLCVEVENSGDGGADIGYVVERVEVVVGGDGAKPTLIGWVDGTSESPVFPLFIGSKEQFNLLYAVEFQHSPDDVDLLSPSISGKDSRDTNTSRSITIFMHGKPYQVLPGSQKPSDYLYPSRTFSSRWNSVLDLSTARRKRPISTEYTTSSVKDVLPEPASPFPLPLPNTPPVLPSASAALESFQRGVYAATGSKRHTLPSNLVAMRALRTSGIIDTKLSLAASSQWSPPSQFSPPPASPGVNMRSYTPPSITVEQQSPRLSTTYVSPSVATTSTVFPEVRAPTTPAYPAFPVDSTTFPNLLSQGPVVPQKGNAVGPNVEIRREKGSGLPSTPGTPGPVVPGAYLEGVDPPIDPNNEPIFVSVSLAYGNAPENRSIGNQSQRKIYPLDEFMLEIFVFNRSSWVRRLEIAHPDRTHRRGQQSVAPGILPLDNRIRIGPLRPSACQSVRMHFLALSPGLHSIDFLTLTDVETGFSMNLRSVMDVAVHTRTNS